MTTIDHRILIPAPPDVVWDYISDITHNPDWQTDCSEVIFLTSRREGPGVRWRYSKPDGHECVIAVSAWYNGLGYEYYFVDGMPFRDNKGRIRLQEIPEGTIVQWTFTYELGGLLGGVRNALGVSRDVDHLIADSLKTLWQKIKQSTGTVSRVYEAKSLMRDAPDVEARSNYRPRHPSAAEGNDETAPQQREFVLEPPIHEDDGQPISIIAEPPIVEDDTRPRIAVTEPAEAAPVFVDMDSEPGFLNLVSEDLSRFEPPRSPSDTQPKHAPEPVVTPEPITPAPVALEPEPEPALRKGEETEPLGFTPPESLPGYLPSLFDEREEQTAPAFRAADETQPEFAEKFAMPESAVEAAIPEPEPVTPAPEPVLETPKPEVPPALRRDPEPYPEPSSSKATASSIWEVFGVPRPSEIEQPDEAKPKPEPAATAPEAPAPAKTIRPASGVTPVGLRLTMRRKLAHVRRP
ncbi:MAG: SRPBCC family protein [Anaerolineae bacterium]|nr:SRPBCC family protein [Anaerolineae bacterium]